MSNISTKQYEEWVNLANKASDAYYDNDEPIMEDPEFDALMLKIKGFEKTHGYVAENSPTVRVGGHASKSSFEKVEHKVPMLSLQDVFNTDDVKDFLVSNSPKLYYSVEEKIDGLSMSATYENGVLVRAETRGDGYIGEDITENAKFINGVPKYLKNETDGLEVLEVRFEVYLPIENFLKLNKEREESGEKLFANPRNAAAGILRTKDVSAVKKAGLYAFAFNVQRIEWMQAKNNPKLAEIMDSHCAMLYVLKLWGFEPVPYEQVKESDVLKEIENIGKRRNNLPYWIDGAVVKIDSIKEREKLGATNKYPRWAVAYKYPPEEKETVVRDIVLQTGRTGRVTPVAVLEPVYLAGTKVERATLNNQAFIKKLDVNIGDTVKIRKAAEIIPEIIACSKGNNKETSYILSSYRIDTHPCPACGGALKTSEDLRSTLCTNPECCAKKARMFEFWASRDCMDIRGLGPAQIDIFIKQGFLKTIPDIYKLVNHKDEILKLPNFAEKGVNNLLNSIENSKGRNIDRLIKALGIEGVGRHVGAKLAQRYPTVFDIGGYTLGTQSKEDKIKELSSIDGVGEILAENIFDFFTHKNIAILFELQKLGVNIKSKTYVSAQQKENNFGVFTDKKFVITGTFSKMSREELTALIEENGGKVSGSVSSKTDYLVLGENPGSKLQKAKSLGVKILEEKEFFRLL